MDKYNTIMMVFIASVRQNYNFIHLSFVQNVTHMTFFSNRAHEFLNWENSAKAKTHHSGTFAPREITRYTVVFVSNNNRILE